MTAAGSLQVASEAQEQLLSSAKHQQDLSGFLVGFRYVPKRCAFCKELFLAGARAGCEGLVWALSD